MTDPMLTNEMKRYAVIVSLKADHGNLEIACFLTVAISFANKIRKELEKENDNTMFISKRKKTFHPFLFNEDTRMYSYIQADN